MLKQKCWYKKIFQNLFSPNKFGHKKFGSYNLLVKKNILILKPLFQKIFIVQTNFWFTKILNSKQCQSLNYWSKKFGPKI